jgi:hypothetical protein
MLLRRVIYTTLHARYSSRPLMRPVYMGLGDRLAQDAGSHVRLAP